MDGVNYSIRQLVKPELVEIAHNYKVLHFDDFPILYIGTNMFGNKIIGSHFEEDDENKKIICLHTILTNKQYYDFLTSKTSYLYILKSSESICLVEKDYNFKVLRAYDFDFNSIPAEYLPLEDSYCPVTVKAHSLNFSISLKGKLADINKAVAEEVSKIQNGFTEFIEDRVNSIKGLCVVPKALLEPYGMGSFRLNFELELNQKGNKGNLFLQQAPVDKYLANYLTYITSNFIEDKENYKPNNNDASEPFLGLEQTLSEVYDKACIAKPDNLRQLLKEDIIKSVLKFEKVSDEVGDNFDSLLITSTGNEEETPISYIDHKFSESFGDVIEEVEIAHKGVTVDQDFKEYKIYIYHLNTDTRTGNALIRNVDNDEEMSKPKIKIDGEEGLEKTKYTESLYLNKWITVAAKAKKIGEKFSRLDIKFEE
jgi:hypothetical protein